MKKAALKSKRGNKYIRIREQPSKGLDYLSHLPIDLIICILSLLPFTDWVAMSQVSKQWMNLWTHVKTLNIDEIQAIVNILERSSPCVLCGKVIDHSSHPCLEFLAPNAKIKFMEQVSSVLQHHSGDTITKLTFSLQHDNSGSHKTTIDEWIRSAMTMNIEDMELNFIKWWVSGHNFLEGEIQVPSALDNSYEFPVGQFEPKILKSLALRVCKFRTSGFKAFASLNTLILTKVKIMDSSIGDLISRCPVLKDLTMYECVLADRYLVCEQRMHINELTLMYCMGNNGRRIPIDIAVPNLSIIIIEGDYLMESNIREAASLDEVTINIYQGPVESSSGNILGSLLSDIRYCKTLNLTSWCIQVLPTGDNLLNSLTTGLYSLEHLTLHLGFIKQELLGISCLLRSCPNLQYLTFTVCPSDNLEVNWGEHGYMISYIDHFDEDTYWESQNISYECLQKSLIEVRIIGYTESAAELKFMEFLFKHGAVLGHIITQSSRTGIVRYVNHRYPIND